MSTSINPTYQRKNVNEIWKQLHPIFQAQLRSYILSNNKQKFNNLAKELHFNTLQTQFLFDAIQIAEIPPPLYNPSHTHQSTRNKRQITNGTKRRRNPRQTRSPSSSDIDTNCNNNPCKKRRKTNDLSEKEINEMGLFIVDCIIGHKDEGNNIYKYKVKWIGYDDEMTWEPQQHLQIKTIKKYWKNKGFKIDKNGIIKPIKSKHNNKTECDDNINDIHFENSFSFEMECHICKINFTDYNAYRTHLKEHYDNNTNKNWLVCEFCAEENTETP
eukprot:99897_1